MPVWQMPVALLLCVVLCLLPARAATHIVVTVADSGAGSLRQAVADAASGDVIQFDARLSGAKITLTSGALVLGHDLTIDGRTLANLTVSGGNRSRAFEISAGSVTLAGLTIADGQTHWSPRATQAFQTGGGGMLNAGRLRLEECILTRNVSLRGGGALENFGELTLTGCQITGNYAGLDGGGLTNNGTAQISGCTISGNYALNGAGVCNNGTLSVQNSTFNANSAANEGGGLENFGTLNLCSCTIAGNSARSAGGGLANFQSANLNNNIIAANACADAAADADVSGSVVSQGFNFIGIGESSGASFSSAKHDQTGLASTPLDAKLGLLKNNGGLVPTMALLPGSPALNSGDDGVVGTPYFLTTDARGAGFARKRGAQVDIGAFESVPSASLLTVNNARTTNEGSAAAPGFTTFTVTLSAPYDQIVTVNYNTANGAVNGATAGSDFVAKSGTLSFAPGETVKYVKTVFIGDNVAEANETFFLDLKTPLNATITDSRGSAYIRNDDGPQIFIDNAVTVNEGNAGTAPQTFKVRLLAASSDTVSVKWATASGTAGPADYTVASGTITFAPGETTKTIIVLIKGDTLVEATETYKVNLTTPTFAVVADSQAAGYIRDDDGIKPLLSLQEQDDPSL